ncbi:MAG: hypothetical protein WCT36_05735 [Candidatus Gracilibacteria bacterium]
MIQKATVLMKIFISVVNAGFTLPFRLVVINATGYTAGHTGVIIEIVTVWIIITTTKWKK